MNIIHRVLKKVGLSRCTKSGSFIIETAKEKMLSLTLINDHSAMGKDFVFFRNTHCYLQTIGVFFFFFFFFFFK